MGQAGADGLNGLPGIPGQKGARGEVGESVRNNCEVLLFEYFYHMSFVLQTIYASSVFRKNTSI